MTPVYVLVAAFLCLAHALLVGAGGRPLLSDTGCKLLSMVALIYGLLESVAFDEHISYSLGHFLLFVQVVLLFGPHRLRELRLIPIVVLFELMVAGIWALDLIYLPAFVLSGAALMANLMAVDMHSDSGERRRRPAERAAERRIGARDFAGRRMAAHRDRVPGDGAAFPRAAALRGPALLPAPVLADGDGLLGERVPPGGRHAAAERQAGLHRAVPPAGPAGPAGRPDGRCPDAGHLPAHLPRRAVVRVSEAMARTAGR